MGEASQELFQVKTVELPKVHLAAMATAVDLEEE